MTGMDRPAAGGEAAADRDRGKPQDALAVRVRSYRWKAAAFAVGIAGVWASLAAMGVILQIDGTAAASHMNPSQDAVGITAMTAGLSGMTAAVMVAVRWWRRPALRLTGQALTVYQRRPVAIPWTMIADEPSPGPPGSGRGRPGRIVLAGGQELNVRGLRRLAELTAPQQDPAASAVPPGSSPRSWLALPLPAALPVPPDPGAAQLRDRWAAELPGPPLRTVRARFPWPLYGSLMLCPPLFGFMVLAGGRSGLDVGGSIVVTLVSGAVAGLLLVCCWATLTRTVAAGPGWLAWRPRLTGRWRMLALTDVVSTIDLQWPRRQGVRLTRADGTGLRLRGPELAAGLGRAVGVQLAEHPAATAEFLTAVLAAAPPGEAAAQPGGLACSPASVFPPGGPA